MQVTSLGHMYYMWTYVQSFNCGYGGETSLTMIKSLPYKEDHCN